MTVKDQLNRIVYIDYLITKNVANTTHTLAQKLQLSKRQTINIINLMKELGSPIEYNSHLKCYYYKENKKFRFGYD
jgi:predicted DNA-binding transcriptional regulator YafY